MKYFKIRITETGADKPGGDADIFNVDTKLVTSREDIRSYIVDRYGKDINTPRRKKIYVDTKQGEQKQVGFLYSFWNKDWSHNSKSWYQTDWIEITEIEEHPFIL